MAEPSTNPSITPVIRNVLKMDLPKQSVNNSTFGFRPLPGQPNLNANSDLTGNGNRPKMFLPKVANKQPQPTAAIVSSSVAVNAVDQVIGNDTSTRTARFGPSERVVVVAKPTARGGAVEQQGGRFKIGHSMQSSGKLQFGEDEYEFTSEDLQDLGEIGRGGFGTVNKMIHGKSDHVLAVKRIRSTVDEKEQKQLLMDLEVVMKSNECPYIVQFYGALFKEGDCWICMEVMDTSLDKFYKFIYEKLNKRIPEEILGQITVATVQALNYLKEELRIIHRDVKPSNILLDKQGNIKLCDFGISGQLVDSIARTRDAGCRPYMAPERIDPQGGGCKGYDVRSDVWSLGITLMEVATGHFPYPRWSSVFDQLAQVVNGDPPRLTPTSNGNTYTSHFVDFVNTCLSKAENQRPKYKLLLEKPFIKQAQQAKQDVDVAAYVSHIMDEMANNGISAFTTNLQ